MENQYQQRKTGYIDILDRMNDSKNKKNKVTIEVNAKNFKRYYIPSVSVLYFTETEINFFDNLSKEVVEQLQFVKIGDFFNSSENAKAKRLNQKFFSWVKSDGKKENEIQKPSLFFKSEIGEKLINFLKTKDLVLLVYKTHHLNSLAYVNELVDIMAKFDVFAFHCCIENYISSTKAIKEYQKLVLKIKKRRQVHIPIKEANIVSTYEEANIANRMYYINLYVNNLVESIVSPFFDPEKNRDLFSRVKALFYQDKNNFESDVYTSLGYSDDKEDYLDFALINALSNPMLCAAFDVADSFVVNIKVPFVTSNTKSRVEYVLKNVLGNNKKFLVSTYIGDFDFDVYSQISLLAINVDENRLINDPEKINSYVRKILKEVSESKELFNANVTRTLSLDIDENNRNYNNDDLDNNEELNNEELNDFSSTSLEQNEQNDETLNFSVLENENQIESYENNLDQDDLAKVEEIDQEIYNDQIEGEVNNISEYELDDNKIKNIVDESKESFYLGLSDNEKIKKAKEKDKSISSLEDYYKNQDDDLKNNNSTENNNLENNNDLLLKENEENKNEKEEENKLNVAANENDNVNSFANNNIENNENNELKTVEIDPIVLEATSQIENTENNDNKNENEISENIDKNEEVEAKENVENNTEDLVVVNATTAPFSVEEVNVDKNSSTVDFENSFYDADKLDSNNVEQQEQENKHTIAKEEKKHWWSFWKRKKDKK